MEIKPLPEPEKDFDLVGWNRFMGPIIREIRVGLVRKLLAGNDTQCFSTEQYRESYSKSTWGNGVERMIDHGLARAHLLGLPDVVEELKPDVLRRIDER